MEYYIAPMWPAETVRSTSHALIGMHACVTAMIRLTGSDDLMERLRPGMASYANDPDFRRETALVGIESGIPHVKMTPELYGRLIDMHADRMLRQVGAA